MTSSVTEQAYRLRRDAEAGPIGKRKTSFELYALLADCMALAERCGSDPVAFAEMKGLVAQQPTQNKRRYVERGSDEYQLVCRFVFAELKTRSAERSNASRYAACLRQARKLGITSSSLGAHLREQGGINALFLSRPLVASTVTTRCLNLTQPITDTKGAPIRLVLRRTDDNRYDVLEIEGPR